MSGAHKQWHVRGRARGSERLAIPGPHVEQQISSARPRVADKRARSRRQVVAGRPEHRRWPGLVGRPRFQPRDTRFLFLFFLFHFKLPIFKLNLNSCFELYIPNLKQNPNVNVNPKIFNIIVYSPSQYLILATNDFITTFFFSFSVLYFHL